MEHSKKELTQLGYAAEADTSVLAFIHQFHGAETVFLYGMCYWFSYILQGRFGGTMMYEQVENHFVQEIGGRLYDASGDVTELYGQSKTLMRWDEMKDYDEALYHRLVKYCILKGEG